MWGEVVKKKLEVGYAPPSPIGHSRISSSRDGGGIEGRDIFLHPPILWQQEWNRALVKI
jgi:hypothetical protein